MTLKFSAFGAASALTGGESEYIVGLQDGANVKVTPAQLRAFVLGTSIVTANDDNARLTVDGTQRGVEKAISVEVDGVTHYWPLFNGESDAGPAPPPVLAFTDLTDVDAPTGIVANSLLIGSEDGTSLRFVEENEITRHGNGTDTVTHAFGLKAMADEFNSPMARAVFNATSYPSLPSADGNIIVHAELYTDHDITGEMKLYARADASTGTVGIEKGVDDIFEMMAFDVTAYDDAARLTVGAVSYGIDKAISVKIGGTQYYWPLFNGETDAGPAPPLPVVVAFTELTDAPTSITPNGFLVGKADGTGVEFLPGNELRLFSTGPTGDDVNNTFYFSAYTDGGYSPPDGAINFWAAAHPVTDIGIGSLELLADSSLGNAQLKIQAIATATAVEVSLQKNSTSDFSMVYFDVAASDSAARLMVDGTQYGIDAAIKVKISGVTHYWPLFNGETDAGDAPSGPITVVGRSVQLNLDALNYDAGMDGGAVGLNAGNGGVDNNGGSFAITAGAGYGSGIGGDLELTAGDSDSGRGNINLVGGAININNTTAVATQEVVVPLVGTMTFTHGLLTDFTPA